MAIVPCRKSTSDPLQTYRSGVIGSPLRHMNPMGQIRYEKMRLFCTTWSIFVRPPLSPLGGSRAGVLR